MLFACDFDYRLSSLPQAKQMVGSTLLVREGDRPELDEDEFYTPDLFNMRVFLKVHTYSTIIQYTSLVIG